ncbi:Gti1/Pac2 family-domain-containing protein [Sparassis latifolia]
MFHAPLPDAQHPTHPRLHVRDARDAHIVFEAVRQGMLQPVVRRLNEMERYTYIKSGSIFVWEESEQDSGLKRWTDGRVWSQSHMREPYLFYDEKVTHLISRDSTTRNISRNSHPTYRFIEGPSRTWTSSAQSHYERSDHSPAGLVKQAYSAWVRTPGNVRPRKWHLTAYFSYSDLPNIPTVDQDPILRTLTVPEGVYQSGKTKSRGPDGVPATSTPLASPASSRNASFHTEDHGALPPLPLPVLHHPLPDPRHRVHPRGPEDQRMIGMLDSQPIL